MIKKLSELDKQEKIWLLEAIANGEIDRGLLTPDSLCAVEYTDYFQGVIISANQINNDDVRVICLGPARLARDLMHKIEGIEVVNGDGKITETINYIKPNFL